MKKLIVLFFVLLNVSCTTSNSGVKNNKATANKSVFDFLKLDRTKRGDNKRKFSTFDKKYATKGDIDVNYNRAVYLIDNGRKAEGINILQSLVNNFPQYAPARDILDRLESPFSLSSAVVEQRLDEWISAPTDVPAFELQKPVKPTLARHPVLIKDEFETTGQFKLRVKIAEEKYQKEVDSMRNTYKEEIKQYNKAVNTYNTEIDWERKNRAEKVPDMRKRYLDIAFTEALGNPVISTLNYDADNENFYGKVISENDNLSFDVEIPVLLSEAKKFKEDIVRIKPSIKIDMIDGNIVFSKINFNHEGKIYPGKLLGAERVLATVADVTIGKKDVDFDKNIVILKVKDLEIESIVEDNHQFFIPKN